MANTKIKFPYLQDITASKILGRTSAGNGEIQEITLGTNLSMSGTTLNATGGGTPGGSTTELQWNNASAFDGISTFTTDGTDITGTGLLNLSGGTVRLPVSATPSVTVNGDISLDTTVTDFSLGILKFYGGEEQGIVSMPIAEFTTPVDGSVLAYNATNDEFELITIAAGLTYWNEAYNNSAPNATITVVSLAPDTGDTNTDAVFSAKGTGATLASIPDSTATGGNKRGTYATDWQKSRTTAAQVASGIGATIGGGIKNSCQSDSGVIAGGESNTASSVSYAAIGGGFNNSVSGAAGTIAGGASNSIATGIAYQFIGGGSSNSNSSYWGVICGGNSNATGGNYAVIGGGHENWVGGDYAYIVSGSYGWADLHGYGGKSSGRFTNRGDAQEGDLMWRRSITGTAATELFLDGASVRAILTTNSGNNKVWSGLLKVTAIVKTVGNGTVTLGDTYDELFWVTIKRLTNTTTLIAATSLAQHNDAGAAGTVVTVTADDTNEALKIEVTPATNAGSTTVTLAVATLNFNQIAF